MGFPLASRWVCCGASWNQLCPAQVNPLPLPTEATPTGFLVTKPCHLHPVQKAKNTNKYSVRTTKDLCKFHAYSFLEVLKESRSNPEKCCMLAILSVLQFISHYQLFRGNIHGKVFTNAYILCYSFQEDPAKSHITLTRIFCIVLLQSLEKDMILQKAFQNG